MLDGQKFKTVVFGGFDRRHVVQYITGMASRFNSDVESLKKGYESQIEKKDSEILEYEAKCEVFLAEIKNLRDQMLQIDKERREEVAKKTELISLKDRTIYEMDKKIKNLQCRLDVFKKENEKIENKVKYAEVVAKERVKKILQQAKQKVEQEYRENLALVEKDGRCLRKKAREEASRILKNAASRAYEFTTESKEEARRMVEGSQKRADEILSSARLAVENMLKNGARLVADNVELGDLEQISVDFDVNFLKSKIDEEVEIALKRLNQECESNEKAS